MFSHSSGACFNKTDDDNISIMAPHQSYFDEYPSGTGKRFVVHFNMICIIIIIIYFVNVRASVSAKVSSSTIG
jgi:hypothetical protein